MWYAFDTVTGNSVSLKTRVRTEAVQKVNAMNETERQPGISLGLARVYLNATDPKLATRTGISGVSLHCYRYAWAERALKCGFPERFAQQALGHNSKAVHRSYSKLAEVTVPSLDDWEKEWEVNGRSNAKPKLLPVNYRLPMLPAAQSN